MASRLGDHDYGEAAATSAPDSGPAITAVLADDLNALTHRIFRQRDRLRKAVDGVRGEEPPRINPATTTTGSKIVEANPLDLESSIRNLKDAFETMVEQISRFYSDSR